MTHPYDKAAEGFEIIANGSPWLTSNDRARMHDIAKGLRNSAQDFYKAHGEYDPKAVGSLTRRVEKMEEGDFHADAACVICSRGQS